MGTKKYTEYKLTHIYQSTKSFKKSVVTIEEFVKTISK